MEELILSQQQSSVDATLVVTYSLERLDTMLQGLCDSWGGPISAGVYHPRLAGDVAADKKVAKAAKRIRKVHKWYRPFSPPTTLQNLHPKP